MTDFAKAESAYIHHSTVPVAVVAMAAASSVFARGRFPKLRLVDVVAKKERTRAGLRTIKATIAKHGKFTARRSGIVRERLGRPAVSAAIVAAVRAELARGTGILSTAKRVGCGWARCSGSGARCRLEEGADV